MLKTKSKESIEIKTNVPKARRFSEIDINDVKIMLYGPFGSGKTRTVGELLEAGLTILYFSTDSGGSGLLTVKNYLRSKNKMELAKNLIVMESKYLETYDKVISFLERPDKFVDNIYDLDIDLVFWDGFSNFQGEHVSRKVN